MKIIYILKSVILWGGGERIMIEKMNYLSAHYNYDITLLTIAQGTHKLPYSLNNKIKHIDLNISINEQYHHQYPNRLFIKLKIRHLLIEGLKKYIKRINPNAISCLTDDYVDCILEAKSKEIPLIAESHNLKCYTRNKAHSTVIQKIMRYLYFNKIKYVDRLVTITSGDAADWKSIKSATIIPNCIHYNEGAVSNCENKKIILVGRLSYQKGIDTAIEVWEQIYRTHKDWSLHIFGEGELHEDVVSLIKEKHLESNIILHKPTSNIFEEYRNSSIYLSTARYEAFGLAMAEAMSCGIPCVSFNCPYGPKDIITDQEDGFIIQQNNISDMVDALDLLIKDSPKRKIMGKAAHTNSRKFHPDYIMPMWKTLFEHL